jgi:hypothetical protein
LPEDMPVLSESSFADIPLSDINEKILSTFTKKRPLSLYKTTNSRKYEKYA